jgi:small GTP-binding protein
MSADYDYLFKILLLGSSGVGKTSFLLRYTDDTFTKQYLATIGCDFKNRKIDHLGQTVKVQLWDTCGGERFRTITQSYYRRVQGIILAYSVDDRSSFEHIPNWMREISRHVAENGSIFLTGNKCDSEDRVVSWEEGLEMAQKLGVPYFETSAMLGLNVNEVFATICQMILEKNVLTEKKKSCTSVAITT